MENKINKSKIHGISHCFSLDNAVLHTYDKEICTNVKLGPGSYRCNFAIFKALNHELHTLISSSLFFILFVFNGTLFMGNTSDQLEDN